MSYPLTISGSPMSHHYVNSHYNFSPAGAAVAAAAANLDTTTVTPSSNPSTISFVGSGLVLNGMPLTMMPPPPPPPLTFNNPEEEEGVDDEDDDDEEITLVANIAPPSSQPERLVPSRKQSVFVAPSGLEAIQRQQYMFNSINIGATNRSNLDTRRSSSDSPLDLSEDSIAARATPSSLASAVITPGGAGQQSLPTAELITQHITKLIRNNKAIIDSCETPALSRHYQQYNLHQDLNHHQQQPPMSLSSTRRNSHKTSSISLESLHHQVDVAGAHQQQQQQQQPSFTMAPFTTYQSPTAATFIDMANAAVVAANRRYSSAENVLGGSTSTNNSSVPTFTSPYSKLQSALLGEAAAAALAAPEPAPTSAALPLGRKFSENLTGLLQLSSENVLARAGFRAGGYQQQHFYPQGILNNKTSVIMPVPEVTIEPVSMTPHQRRTLAEVMTSQMDEVSRSTSEPSLVRNLLISKTSSLAHLSSMAELSHSNSQQHQHQQANANKSDGSIIKDLLLKSRSSFSESNIDGASAGSRQQDHYQQQKQQLQPQHQPPPRKKSRTESFGESHGQQQTSGGTSSSMFACTLCQVTFRNRQNLDVHQMYYCRGKEGDHHHHHHQQQQQQQQQHAHKRSLDESMSSIERKVSLQERPSIISYTSDHHRPSSSLSNSSTLSSISTNEFGGVQSPSFGYILKSKLLGSSGNHDDNNICFEAMLTNKRRKTSEPAYSYNYAEFRQKRHEVRSKRSSVIHAPTMSRLERQAQDLPHLEILPAYTPYLMRPAIKITLKLPIIFQALESLIERGLNHEFIVDTLTASNQFQDHLERLIGKHCRTPLLPALPSAEANKVVEEKDDQEAAVGELLEQILDRVELDVNFEPAVVECLEDVLEKTIDGSSDTETIKKSSVPRPTTLAFSATTTYEQSVRHKSEILALPANSEMVYLNRRSAVELNSPLAAPASRREGMVASTLLSPDTPRAKRKYQQVHLNGAAYTNLCLKVTTPPTFCCLDRPFPMTVQQEAVPQLSFYGEWRARPAPAGDILEVLGNARALLAAYDSREAVSQQAVQAKHLQHLRLTNLGGSMSASAATTITTNVTAQGVAAIAAAAAAGGEGGGLSLGGECGAVGAEQATLAGSIETGVKKQHHEAHGKVREEQRYGGDKEEAGEDETMKAEEVSTSISDFLDRTTTRLHNLGFIDKSRLVLERNTNANSKSSATLTRQQQFPAYESIRQAVVVPSGLGTKTRLLNTTAGAKYLSTYSNYHQQVHQVSPFATTKRRSRTEAPQFSMVVGQNCASGSSMHEPSNEQQQQQQQQAQAVGRARKRSMNNVSFPSVTTCPLYSNQNPLLGHIPAGQISNALMCLMMSQTSPVVAAPRVGHMIESINLAARKFSECIGLRQPSAVASYEENWTTRICSDGHTEVIPKRIKIFEGGFKSNEDYTYVRGRGRGKYVCEDCGIRCKKPSMLKKHIRTHTDLRPYSCRHCAFAFKTKGNLTKHMKSKAHHKKCVEMGVIPVPTTIDDSQIDSDALAKQEQYELAINGGVGQFADDEDEGDDDYFDDEEEDEEDEGVPIPLIEQQRLTYITPGQFDDAEASGANEMGGPLRKISTNSNPGSKLRKLSTNMHQQMSGHPLSASGISSGAQMTPAPAAAASMTSDQHQIVTNTVIKSSAVHDNNNNNSSSSKDDGAIGNEDGGGVIGNDKSPSTSTTTSSSSPLMLSANNAPTLAISSDGNIYQTATSIATSNMISKPSASPISQSSSTSSSSAVMMMRNQAMVGNSLTTSAETVVATSKPNETVVRHLSPSSVPTTTNDEAEAVRSLLILSGVAQQQPQQPIVAPPPSQEKVRKSSMIEDHHHHHHHHQQQQQHAKRKVSFKDDPIIRRHSPPPSSYHSGELNRSQQQQQQLMMMQQMGMHMANAGAVGGVPPTTTKVTDNRTSTSFPTSVIIANDKSRGHHQQQHHQPIRQQPQQPQPTFALPTTAPHPIGAQPKHYQQAQVETSTNGKAQAAFIAENIQRQAMFLQHQQQQLAAAAAAAASTPAYLQVQGQFIPGPHQMSKLYENLKLPTQHQQQQQQQAAAAMVAAAAYSSGQYLPPMTGQEPNGSASGHHSFSINYLGANNADFMKAAGAGVMLPNSQLASLNASFNPNSIRTISLEDNYNKIIQGAPNVKVESPKKDVVHVNGSNASAFLKPGAASVSPITRTIHQHKSVSPNTFAASPHVPLPPPPPTAPLSAPTFDVRRARTSSTTSNGAGSPLEGVRANIVDDQPMDLSKSSTTTTTEPVRLQRNTSPTDLSLPASSISSGSKRGRMALNEHQSSSGAGVYLQPNFKTPLARPFSPLDLHTLPNMPVPTSHHPHAVAGRELYNAMRSEEFYHKTPGIHTPNRLPGHLSATVLSPFPAASSLTNFNAQQVKLAGSAAVANSAVPSPFTPEGKSVCSFCAKQFSKPSQLRLHINIHLFERPFRCEACAISFRTKGHLQKHSRSVSHLNKMNMNNTFGRASNDNPRPFKCTDCKIAFRIHGHLAKHLRSKMHIMKLECLGKLPFGMYAEIERSNISLNLIDTTNCVKAYQSLRQLAETLYDPRKMTWKPPDLSQINGDDESEEVDGEEDDDGGMEDGEVIEEEAGEEDMFTDEDELSNENADQQQLASMVSDSIQEMANSPSQPQTLGLSGEGLACMLSGQMLQPLSSSSSSSTLQAPVPLSPKQVPLASSPPTTLAPGLISTRSNTCHICGRLFKGAKFLQVHLYQEHPDAVSASA